MLLYAFLKTHSEYTAVAVHVGRNEHQRISEGLLDSTRSESFCTHTHTKQKDADTCAAEKNTHLELGGEIRALRLRPCRCPTMF